MSEVVIQINNISKEYQLGVINHGSLSKELQSKWAKFLGKDDPNAKIDLLQQYKLTKSDQFLALDDISFSVWQGEVLGIIGSNGAGKSTLLKILSRITAPTKGNIRIKGRIASLLEVGTGFHPELTGRENIFLNGAILGMRKGEIEEKFDEIIQFAEIEKFIDTPVKRYSSGMFVRLAFAVAAHLDPEILLVDEVLAVGDINFRQKCMKKMKNVSVGGRTVLFVSHDLASIRNLCSRVLWIEKGAIKLDGPANIVTHEYEKASLNIIKYSNGHFDRKTTQNKKFYIEWVELRNNNGNLCTSYNYGDDLTIIFSMSDQAPQGGYTIEWILFNESGSRISFGSANPLCNVYFDKKIQKVSCILKSLPLTVGYYNFYFSVRIWGMTRWDEWENEVGFRVSESDPYKTGFSVPNGVCGDFIIDQHWNTI